MHACNCMYVCVYAYMYAYVYDFVCIIVCMCMFVYVVGMCIYIYIIHTYVCVRITLLYHSSWGGLRLDWTITPFVHRRLNPPSSWPSLGSTSSSSWDWWRLSGGQMLGRTHTRNGQLKENSWLNDFQSMDCSLNFRPTYFLNIDFIRCFFSSASDVKSLSEIGHSRLAQICAETAIVKPYLCNELMLAIVKPYLAAQKNRKKIAVMRWNGCCKGSKYVTSLMTIGENILCCASSVTNFSQIQHYSICLRNSSEFSCNHNWRCVQPNLLHPQIIDPG